MKCGLVFCDHIPSLQDNRTGRDALVDVEELELAEAGLAQVEDLAEANRAVQLRLRLEPLKVHVERLAHGVRARLDGGRAAVAAQARLLDDAGHVGGEEREPELALLRVSEVVRVRRVPPQACDERERDQRRREMQHAHLHTS